jgi:hypothetical protein
MRKAVAKSSVIRKKSQQITVEISPRKWAALEKVAAVLGEAPETLARREIFYAIDNAITPDHGLVESEMDGRTYESEHEAREAAARVNAYRSRKFMPFEVEPVEGGAGWRLFDSRRRLPMIVVREPVEV